jgi:hypothetical protein
MSSSYATGVEPPPAAGTRGENAALVLLCAIVGFFYFWCAAQPAHGWLRDSPPGMYGMLTEAFAAGQIHLKPAPPAELVALPDPYDPTANARYRLHDATYFRGKYYLYFGASPSLVLFLPWNLVFGSYLSEEFAVAFFAFIGFMATVALLLRLRRWHFPALPFFWLALGILAAGLGNMTGLLVQWPDFYKVPISCGVGFLMISFWAIHHALVSARWSAGWLVVASSAFGIAMGARPNYVLAGFLVFLPTLCWLVASRRGTSKVCSWRTGRLFCAAFGPLGVVGLSMLAYNHLRFGSPFEFGVKYQLAGQSMLNTPVLDFSVFGENIRHYFFDTARFSPYFPFFVGGEEGALGLAWGSPLLWFLLPVPVVFLSSRLTARPALVAMIATVTVVGTATFFMNCSYFVRVYRYVIDFYPAVTLAGICAWLALVAGVTRKWRTDRWIAWVGGLMAIGMVALNLAMCAARFASPAQLEPVGRLLNEPMAWWQRTTGTELGAHRLKVTFPTGLAGRSEPLVTTGIWGSNADVLFVEYVEGDQIRLGFFHIGMGGPKSRPLKIAPDSVHTIEVTFGGLLPPPLHPTFRNWNSRSIEVARQTVRVKFDGEVVLNGAVDSFPSRPSDLRYGDSRWDYGFVQKTFTGKIHSTEVQPLREADYAEPPVPLNGPLEFSVVMPFLIQWHNEPLLATGGGQEHDLIYLIFCDPGKLRIALNHHRFAGPVSEEFEYDPSRPQSIRIWMSNLASASPAVPPSEAEAWKSRLFVTFNDRVALDAPQTFYPTRADQLVLGRNPHGAGSAGPRFSGRIERIAVKGRGSLPVPLTEAMYGAVQMDVVFPDLQAFSSEPMVVTGVTGAGDFIVVRYLEGGKIQFAFDHWGYGGSEGVPVAVKRGQQYRVDVTMGSLYERDPSSTPADVQAKKIEVRLDGAVVLSGSSDTHPAKPENITVAKNTIGGSSCGPYFSGKVVYLFRPQFPAGTLE